MNKTITTIALSVAFLSSAAMANNVHVDTGLQGTLQLLSQHTKNGSALNLAINTNNIDATVNIDGHYNSLNNVGDKVAAETSAIGAVNTGSINLQQGNFSAVTAGTFSKTFDADKNAWHEVEGWHNEKSSGLESSISSTLNNSSYDQFSKTLSNYSAANLAFNSGAIDASVNVDGKVNHIDGIKTSAIGAVNTGSITVTVK
ncbi:MAG: hypothetical protein WAL54_09340, partial [Acinetobacter bohemicus]|jgi:hypothetical protein|uniref:Uncharacterized protein n=1 Tax=Acinetobacter bohemicus TaxID=1435036 RepID=A0A1I6QP27_9GAMM|nr:hypothetical protein [Acinetobacter bohemicus]KAB0650958.1 hypothetical protein F7P73_15125 [Acinetobacter bohemicus]MBP8206855.1 hypothetical protein [Acinetobacter sp.]CAD9197352.1 hypothetical protein QAC21B_03523 [Acinetobacter bohemicus]SFS54216.1 hypothetical protein SAMN05444586_1004156 [Acinetobacter bohemicus]